MAMSGKVNKYFCQFLSLLNQPVQSYLCCENPEIVALDGLGLTIETRRIDSQNFKYPWIKEGISRNRYLFVCLFLRKFSELLLEMNDQ